MGRFKLGSTVITTFSPQMLNNFAEGSGPGSITRLGDIYAELRQTNSNNA
jgi:phosphatidylserine decarboxylase